MLCFIFFLDLLPRFFHQLQVSVDLTAQDAIMPSLSGDLEKNIVAYLHAEIGWRFLTFFDDPGVIHNIPVSVNAPSVLCRYYVVPKSLAVSEIGIARCEL